jgi:Ca2+/Na+ antiporter
VLPLIGRGLAEITGLGQTFVGNIFIAASTTLPEAIVSLYAIRIGSTDLAIGNILGSNIFNIFILAVDDIFFVKGPLLSFANSESRYPCLIRNFNDNGCYYRPNLSCRQENIFSRMGFDINHIFLYRQCPHTLFDQVKSRSVSSIRISHRGITTIMFFFMVKCIAIHCGCCS